MPVSVPRMLAGALTALFVVAVSAAVYSIPIQRSEVLETTELVDGLPLMRSGFGWGFHSEDTFRPMQYLQVKALLTVARASGARYTPVFRGYHALGAAALILMFAFVANPLTWTDVAALAFALSVLTGVQTFPTMFREAYPVNHFLVITLACLVMFALARSRGGWIANTSAALCLIVALQTLESGILVGVLAVAAYLAGLRGISRRTLLFMTLLLVGYMVLRIAVLPSWDNALGERETGYGLRMLSASEQIEMFGRNPLPLYAYNVLSSMLTVLLSQPVVGQWTAVASYLDGEMRPLYVLEITTSLAATLLIAWYMFQRVRSDAASAVRQPVPLTAFAVLLASALLSYAYVKSETMSAAGVLYALAVYVASAELLAVLSRKRLRFGVILAVVAINAVSAGWGVRALGLHYKLQLAAHKARNEWVSAGPSNTSATSTPLASALHDEALLWTRVNPVMLPRAAADYLGED